MTTDFGTDPAYEALDRGRIWRNIGLFVGFVALLNIVVAVGSGLFSERVEGPDGSSFVTTEEGVRGWYELLEELDRPVDRLRQAMPDGEVTPDRSLVVLDPRLDLLDDRYVAAVEAFVVAGGQLITTAGSPLAFGLAPMVEPGSATAEEGRPPLPIAEVAGVSVVHNDRPGVIDRLGPSVPMLTDEEGRHLASVTQLGGGRVVYLGSAAPITNRLLSRADNAAFAVGITAGRPVVFDEYVHGYGADQGFTGVPVSLQRAVIIFLVAALLWMWAAGRRLGPPEQPARALPPARADYVEALAASVAKTRPTEDVYGELRSRGRRLLLGVGAGDELGSGGAAATAAVAGLTEAEVSALRRPVGSEQDALLVGSAVSKLERFGKEGGS